MQQADGDRLDAELAALGGRRVDACLVKLFEHHAAGADTLSDLEDARGGDRPRRFHPGEVVGAAGNVLAPDGEHVAEARRGHQRRLRALALENHVGRDRRAVQHALERRRGLACIG